MCCRTSLQALTLPETRASERENFKALLTAANNEASVRPPRTFGQAAQLTRSLHLPVFECPELLCFREQWSHLFEGPQTMQAFMWQEDLIGVARFINACSHEDQPVP